MASTLPNIVDCCCSCSGVSVQVTDESVDFIVNTIPDLRAVATVGITVRRMANVLGVATIYDSPLMEFVWDANSTTADNGATIIKPDDVAVSAAGRWFQVQ